MGRSGNPYFHFQQFSIQQDRCAMKVGVDGILLGAWASDEAAQRILDIGTGTGLIALMLAQRCPHAHITAIEIDPEACMQAQGNVARSPWPDRIQVQNIAYQEHLNRQVYDLIVSNPPFFAPSSCSTPRAIARQQALLSPQIIVQTVKPHLSPEGRLALIVPFEQADGLIETAIAQNLQLSRRTNIRPTLNSKVKRVLLEISPQSLKLIESDLTLETTRHSYSVEYERLTQDFLLRFASQ